MASTRTATLAAAFGTLFGASANAADCESPYASSPQFVASECRFQNPPNGQAPTQSLGQSRENKLWWKDLR